MKTFKILCISSVLLCSSAATAQEQIPYDNGLATYHTSPQYRPSESHPLRVAAYVVHPIGWIAREVFFRPFSYFVSSTETRRSFFGYRNPYDYRQPECFSADDSAPDCRSLSPYNYQGAGPMNDGSDMMVSSMNGGEKHVYFPDVNFNFDRHALNDLGKGRARQIAGLLERMPEVNVVLQGHADFKGADLYNEKLGMNRSEAVLNELLALGVDQSRVSTVSFGESQPVFSEEEDWARAVNRRVEVHPAS